MKVSGKLLKAIGTVATIAMLGSSSFAAEVKLDENQFVNDYLVADPSTMDLTLRSDTYSSTMMRNVMEGLVRMEEKDGDYM
ncbi:MAG: hypothetical protein EOM02_07570, partial [Synergistales bacterium]|nr:hypothetical protein [Synergistales bacterium]